MSVKILQFFCVAAFFASAACALSRQAYFIDGYHGGVLGHYPKGQTAFMGKKLKENPDWRINLEIEPSTWAVVKARDPEAYEEFRRLFADQNIDSARIEYVNPSYGQSYFWNASGESAIRQFSCGIDELKKHFPTFSPGAYSSQEPCFTSAMPAILKSFGFSYASTKNPGTMWGGYTSAHGGELVNWIGPDGTKILSVPRYACEELMEGSAWQSIAWYNNDYYLEKCFAAGIKNPVGMCLQDAAWSSGWSKGPWIGNDKRSEYETWSRYVALRSTGKSSDDWRFSQEDVLVSLAWGTSVMRELAQNVRRAENAVVRAEKIAALSKLYFGRPWPETELDSAWKTLLLAQHHDCWIVPQNRLNESGTWAQNASKWTAESVENSAKAGGVAFLTAEAAQSGSVPLVVFNTLAAKREGVVRMPLPKKFPGGGWVAVDSDGGESPAQIIDGGAAIVFGAKAPSFGLSFYTLKKSKTALFETDLSVKKSGGKYVMESDIYRLVVNPEKGGAIESLKAKKMGNAEFVGKSERMFNEMRGYFPQDGGWLSSADRPAEVEVLEEGPLLVKIAVKGVVGRHPFTQTIELSKGEAQINMSVRIDWMENTQIGDPYCPKEIADRHKPFYDSSYKLNVFFPTPPKLRELCKDAPFDVCKSRNESSVFSRWDEIKHDIILHWVDISGGGRGLALFTDHTTSYIFGDGHPLGLTLQYSGSGLWGHDYKIEGPTEVSYAVMPHSGDWAAAKLWTAGESRNEPLLAALNVFEDAKPRSFMAVGGGGFELVAAEFKGGDLYLRLFNARGGAAAKTVGLDCLADKIELVEFDGRVLADLDVRRDGGKSFVKVAMPRFGIRTLKLSNPRVGK